VANLHALAGSGLATEAGRATVWELPNDAATLERQDAPGAEAARRTRDALAPYVAGRLRGSLRERVEGAWLALGGPAAATQRSDLEDAETFFDQLDQLERAGDLADPTQLEEHLEKLYAAPDMAEDARLQVMTIHKAKGLEFSTVIVPGLDRPPRPADPSLFAWKARADGSLMMAPIRASGEASDAAYDYLRALDHAAAEHEMQRLLYVAATRARSRLHLLGFARAVDGEEGPRLREPARGSLLCTAWSIAREPFMAALASVPAAALSEPAAPAVARDELLRLDPSVFEVAVAPARAASADEASEAPPAVEFSWVGETARHVGIVVHRWLQRVAADGIERWDRARVAELAPAIARDLARRGIPPAERGAAVARVSQALEGAIADPRGRWLLQPWPGARSEYRLRVAGPEGVRLVVIDRMFTDDAGRRWIVDFKTSSHEGTGLEAFLDRELERYGPQLEGYAQAFPGEPVALGLYFPLVKGWRERV
jgi:ATP-dependent exoDNAse (exonuclease V) beta subunit